MVSFHHKIRNLISGHLEPQPSRPRPRDVRQLIERNLEELERYEGLRRHTANPGPQGGRPSDEFWLNEAQALLLCMKSNAPRAESAGRVSTRSALEPVRPPKTHGRAVSESRRGILDDVGRSNRRIAGISPVILPPSMGGGVGRK
jgi:hypothetical protein